MSRKKKSRKGRRKIEVEEKAEEEEDA